MSKKKCSRTPEHLRPDALKLVCDVCHRQESLSIGVNAKCQRQYGGSKCPGCFNQMTLPKGKEDWKVVLIFGDGHRYRTLPGEKVRDNLRLEGVEIAHAGNIKLKRA